MSGNLAYQNDFEEKRRVELIDGKVVMMAPAAAPNHNHVVVNLSRLFSNYLYGKKCTPFSDGVNLFLDDKNRFVPDFMVICDPDKIKDDGVHGAPDLVVEVLSFGTVKNDRGHKKNVYESGGVSEYWLVNSTDKSVEVYLLENGKYTLDSVYTLYPAEKMADEEKTAIVTEFKRHLYDDLIIRLDDIFGD